MLAALDAEQRAAATLPDGPAQIIAPAGSSDDGADRPAGRPPVARRAAGADRGGDLQPGSRGAGVRGSARLGPLLPGAGRIEVRTLHALARQVLLDAAAARS